MRTTLKLAALAILLVASPAWGQFTAPIRYNEGPGVKLGDRVVFHPGIALEGRYDSNVLFTESAPAGAGYLRIIGHLDLSTLPPQRLTDGDGVVYKPTVEFRTKAALSYREYLNGNDNVKAQRAFEVDAGLMLALFPRSVFSFDVSDDFARTVTGRYQETDSALARDTNRAVLRFRFAPGGGRLSFALSYGLNFDIFEDSKLAGANKIFHEIALNAKWRILPKTAITFDAIEQIYSYYDRGAGVYSNRGLQRNDSTPLRLYLGLVGLFTAQLSTVLKIGYGNGFYENGASYNSVLGIAEVGYQFTPTAKAKLGFEHSFQDSSVFANYYTDENVYLGYDHLIAQRVLLHLQLDYRYRKYQGIPAAVSGEVAQHLASVSLGADYQIKEWVYVGLGYDLLLQNRISGPTTSFAFAPSFTKHQVFGKIGFSY